jgi:4-diphosphocytidyl-2-C-methyl-D-erythritol kinase
MAPPAPARELAPAKVNLDLLVTGRRADGYHELDSLVVFADLGDELTLEPAADRSLEVEGPCAAAVPRDASNSVLRACALLERVQGPLPPARIVVTKRLPVAAGIGGGSADAAALLRLLARVTAMAVGADMIGLALELGADVPACLYARPLRMRGIGERLDPLRGLPDLPLLLVNAGRPVATGPVFQALGELAPAPRRYAFPPRPSLGQLAAWLEGTRNDLERPACRLHPELAEVLALLRELPEALAARLSGSGGTCWALLPDAAALARATEALRARRPDWWIAATLARGAGPTTLLT